MQSTLQHGTPASQEKQTGWAPQQKRTFTAEDPSWVPYQYLLKAEDRAAFEEDDFFDDEDPWEHYEQEEIPRFIIENPQRFIFLKVLLIGIASLILFSLVVKNVAFADEYSVDSANKVQVLEQNDEGRTSQDNPLLGNILGALFPVPKFFETLMQGSSLEGSERAVANSRTSQLRSFTEKEKEALPWNLFLVNPSNPLPEGYEVALVEVEEGHLADQRCLPYLQRMLADCRNAGYSPLICSSYRTQQVQEELFSNKAQRLLAEGLSKEEAYKEAGTVVAVPGTSEHQLGLAFDIVDAFDQNLTDDQAFTPTQQWLMEHSWEYGFVLRYPADKTEQTGIIYEPWHYRYVGSQAAQEMHEEDLCLEEYLAQVR